MQLIDFTTLDTEQLALVLSWRNHPNVRSWMLNSDEILIEDHLRFVEMLKKQPDKRYFLVKRANDYLGVVDLTDITISSAELGIYANPHYHGVGKLLMSALIEYAFKRLGLSRLVANVFAENEKAKSLYQQFHFKETNRTAYNGKEIITMERVL